jgi:hypothetical protein
MGIVAAAILGTILWAHISADQSAAMYLDIQRVSNLQQLNLTIQQYYQDNRVLPADLRHLEQTASPAFIRDGYMYDPGTHQPFEYDVIDANNYKICATFNYSTDAIAHRIPTDTINPVWEHKRGSRCFNFNPPQLIEEENKLIP